MKACSSEAVAPAALGSFLFLASYLNINDPDWILWSSAYGLGGVICGWTVLLQGLNAETETTGGKDSSMIRRSTAMTYGAACLGLAFYSAVLAPGPAGYMADPAEGAILAFLSSEACREASGALIMATAMVICAMAGRPAPETSSPDATRTTTTAAASAVGIVSVVVAVAAIALGMFLPGYLQRAGIAVPAHCGGD